MIRDILLVQKAELEKKLKEKYLERDTALKTFGSRLIKVIIGPRRAGKSFFAMHALSKLGSFGYMNFDDERLPEIKDYDDIINTLDSVYSKPEYLLFDEIQNLDRWELFVNRLQRQGFNLVITGSNSKLLSRELATHLTGRHLPISIFPFSFKEIIRSEGKELTKSEIKSKLTTYLIDGGYPEPFVHGSEYKDYLSTLFNSVMYKDVVKRFKIRSPQGVEDLALYLVSNIAKEVSYNSMAESTRCKSVHTVEKYLGYLEETFIFFRLNRFSFKMKEQLKSNKKIYCIDNGFITAKAFKLSPDTGRLYENLVAAELKKKETTNGASFYYWKNQQQEEVDFVIKQGAKVHLLIQVCHDTTDSKTRERETRALLKAGKELKCKNLLVITGDFEGEEKASWFGIKGRIKYVPLWKWLLEK